MSKKTKNRTPTQQKKHYKRVARITFASEFLSIFAPFITIGIVNWDKYFVKYDGIKMSTACCIAFAMMGLATWLVAKKKFQATYISIIVSWATFTLIFFLLGDLINDLAVIMFFGWFGLVGAEIFNEISKANEKKANEIQKGIDRAKEELTAAAYKEELADKEEKTESKKIKIKIKKRGNDDE